MLVMDKRLTVSRSIPQSWTLEILTFLYFIFVYLFVFFWICQKNKNKNKRKQKKERKKGFILDCSISMHQQVTNTCTTSDIELWRVTSIRQYVTANATKHPFPLLYFPDWTIAMLRSQVYHNNFWTACKESRIRLLESPSRHQNQITLLSFCIHSTGCQCLLEYDTKYLPSVTVPCQILVLNTCPKSSKFMHN